MYQSHQRKLTAAQQYFALKSANHFAGDGRLHRDTLTWEYAVQPTVISRIYKLRIKYSQGEASPKVFVIDPDLAVLAEQRLLPHVFEQKPARLCLYLPRSGEWSPEMRIVDTIIPWSILWLFYFEEWLISNEWKGGGIHPDGKNRKQKKLTPEKWKKRK